jgi:hypothetical protein
MAAIFRLQKRIIILNYYLDLAHGNMSATFIKTTKYQLKGIFSNTLRMDHLYGGTGGFTEK